MAAELLQQNGEARPGNLEIWGIWDLTKLKSSEISQNQNPSCPNCWQGNDHAKLTDLLVPRTVLALKGSWRSIIRYP